MRESHPRTQLALVGSMAHDDPEGWDYYNQTVAAAERRPGHLHPLQPEQRRLGRGERVPGALGGSRAEVHPGGLRADGHRGALEGEADGRRARGRDRRPDPGRRDRLPRRLPSRSARGRCSRARRSAGSARRWRFAARSTCAGNFLSPRLLRDWLALFNRLDGNDLAGAELVDRFDDGLAPSRPGRVSAMAGRRKLIVVSNRAPVTFSRETDGTRIARRGGGGLVTALRSLITHHDVTWVASAMTAEDHVVAAEAGGEPVEEVARRRLPVPASAGRARPAGLRPVLQRRLEPGALVRAALPLGPRRGPEHRQRAPPRVDGGLSGRQPEVRGRGRRGARARAGCGRLLPRLPPLRDARSRTRAGAGRDDEPLRAHPVAAARLLACPSGEDSARGARRAARQRPRQLPHRALVPELPALLRGRARREERLQRRPGHVRGPHRRRPPASHLRRPCGVRRPCGERARARRGGEARGRAPGAPDRPGATAPIRPRTSFAASAPTSCSWRTIPSCTAV